MTDAHRERMREVLEQAYTRLEEGEFPDLAALCAGDEELLGDVVRVFEDDASAMGSLGSFSSPEALPLPAERLGDFRLVSLLGRGGMGSVYLAEQESLGRMVALKVLNPQTAPDPQARARFRREAEIAAVLEHPHIVPVYGIGEDGDYLFIAMKWLAGSSLDQRDDPMEPLEVARIGKALAEALGEAHESGVLHRDVKPANVLMDGDVPVLVDFGLARARQDRTLTSANAAPGTLTYMAPELLQGEGPRFDPRSDLYSLGVTLYELLAGRPPFPAVEPERLMHRILFRDPPPLELRGRGRDLETILFRVMDKEPARRFADGASLAAELRRFLADEPIESVPLSRLTRTWRQLRRHRRVVAAVAGLLLVAAVFTGLFIAAVLRGRAEKRDVLSRAQRLARAGARGEAHRLLETLPATFEGVATLREELRLLGVVETTLDIVQSRAAGVDVEELEALLADLARARASRLDRSSQGRRLLALALGRWHLGDEDGARRATRVLAELAGETRAVAVLRSLMAGEDPPTPLPPLADDPADGVVAVVALREAKAPWDVQDRALRDVTGRWPADFRARLLRATLRAARQEPGLVPVFENLVRNGRHPLVVDRQLLRLHLEARDVAAAREVKERRGPARSAQDRSHDLALLVYEGRLEDFDRELVAARARFGDREEFVFQELLAAHRRDDPETMRRLLAGRGRFEDPLHRRGAELLALELDVTPLMQHYQALTSRPPGAGTDRMEWLEEVAEVREQAAMSEPRAAAMEATLVSRRERRHLARIRGHLRWMADDRRAATDHFIAASRGADHPQFVLDLLYASVQLGTADGVPWKLRVFAHALPRGVELLDDIESLEASQRDLLAHAVATLGHALDQPTAVARVLEVRDSVSAGLSNWLEQQLAPWVARRRAALESR